VSVRSRATVTGSSAAWSSKNAHVIHVDIVATANPIGSRGYECRRGTGGKHHRTASSENSLVISQSTYT
jgi:hypothetical protein